MLVFPNVLLLLYVKAFLFALLIAFVAVAAFAHTSWHPNVVTWTIGLAAVSLIFGIRGLFLDAPGASKCIQVYVFWPLVYLFLLGGINHARIFRGLQKTLVFSAGFIALFGLYFAMARLNIVPEVPHLDALYTAEEMDSGLFLTAGFSEGYVQLLYPGINSMPFLVPFLIATAVSPSSQAGRRWVSRRWLSFSLFLSLAVVLLSGRRGLQLVTMLTPLLILGLSFFQPLRERLVLRKDLRRATVMSLMVVVLSILLISPFYKITFEGLADRFSAGFDFSASNQSDSSVVRVEQYLALMQGWTENPLIGKGLGASAHASIRLPKMPWSYELYYIDLLFQTGLFGFAAYAAGVAWIYWSGIRIIKCGGLGAQFMLPALVGMSGLLIATASNPYLARFDGIWAIFLPLAFINHWLLKHGQIRNTRLALAREVADQI